MSDAIRLQPVVPAGARRGEAVPAIVEPAIPADSHSGSPEAAESPQRLEALVPLAELSEEVMRRLSEARTEQGVAMLYGNRKRLYVAEGKESALAGLHRWLRALETARGTGGNVRMSDGL